MTTLADLIANFRIDSGDGLASLLTSDATATRFFNEAQEEAALRANLLPDSTTPAVCSIAVTAGTVTYPLHNAVFAVTRATFLPVGSTDDPIELDLSDRIEQDRVRPGWRTLTEPPSALIVDDTTVTIACIPDTDGTIALEVYRAPLVPMCLANPAANPPVVAVDPEIGRAHHRFLVLWALHRHFQQPDAEIHDPDRSEKAEIEFTRVFGNRPDAQMRRNHWANAPAYNKAIW